MTSMQCKLTGAAWLALGLSACSFAPLPKLQAPPTSQSYTVQPIAAQGANADGTVQNFDFGAPPVPEWWKLYASDTLDAWVEEGLRNNPSLDASRHTLAAAGDLLRAQVRQNAVPSVDAVGQVSRQRAVGQPGFGPPTNLYNVYAGELQLGYSFDLFGAVRHGNAQARAQVEQQAHEFDAARRTLAANIVIAAIDAAALAEQVATSERMSSLAHAQAELTRRAHELGSASHQDVLDAQQDAAAIDTSLPPLRTQAMRARHALAVLLGRTPDQAPANLALAQLHLPDDVPVSVPSELLKQRPDVMAAEAAVHAAAERVGVATANLFPQLSLNASMGSGALKSSSLFSGSASIWSLGAGITQPIFHGGALRAQRKAALEEYDAALAQYRQTVLNAFQDVANTLTALDQDALALQAAQTAAEAARQFSAESAARHQLGAVAYPAQLASEQRWRNAQLTDIQARQARLADSAALFQAMGVPAAK